MDVRPTLQKGADDFGVQLEVLADESEGPLEYRVYVAGQQPTEGWKAAEAGPGGSRVVLDSPRMPLGPLDTRYGLIVEARSAADQSVQTYPLTFRLTLGGIETFPSDSP
jgi:hypothetical protein